MQSFKDRRRLPLSFAKTRYLTVLATFATLTFAFAVEANAHARSNSAGERRPRNAPASRVVSGAGDLAGCGECQGAVRASRKLNRRAKSLKDSPCHAKGYVDPKIAGKLNAAMRDMKRAGIKPKLTSAWRSSDKQAALHSCALSSRCRRANPGLYRALPPGQSLHEAGFAVDIAGVAAGPRGAKRVTPRGRRIVSIMQRNGFRWPYGLKDPAHFEANPRRYGYRSAKQAIARSQNICDAKVSASSTRRPGRSYTTSHATKRQVSIRQVRTQVNNARTRPRNSRA